VGTGLLSCCLPPKQRKTLMNLRQVIKGGIHTQTRRLIGGIYGVYHRDGHRSHDIHTEFHNDWFRCSKVNNGGTTGTQTRRSCISLLSRFPHETSMLNIEYFLHHITMNLQWKGHTYPVGQFPPCGIYVRPPLWSSGQSSWLQIRRPGFDSRHYQGKKE
jgi:hypothetical protein